MKLGTEFTKLPIIRIVTINARRNTGASLHIACRFAHHTFDDKPDMAAFADMLPGRRPAITHRRYTDCHRIRFPSNAANVSKIGLRVVNRPQALELNSFFHDQWQGGNSVSTAISRHSPGPWNGIARRPLPMCRLLFCATRYREAAFRLPHSKGTQAQEAPTAHHGRGEP